MQKLSAIIIAKNEAANLPRCLASLQGISDEVVVVDSGSTDATPDICASYGARWIEHPWCGFSEQKNFANSIAAYDLLFSIDADEAVTDELRASILHVKAYGGTDVAYAMNRLTNYCGHWIHHCGWYPDDKVRIFNRNAAHWDGQVHETLVLAPGTTVEKLHGDLTHYSYYAVSDHYARTDKYAALGAAEAFARGKRVSFLKMWTHTVWRFIRDYLFKQGFLDGRYGFVVCKVNAWGTLRKYSKLRALWRKG
jgi:glycosyltransferase involved in cell wall biosynthesis